jgi:hypothetical protein
MFDIKFIQGSSSNYQLNNIQIGEIVIGDFREFFHSSLSYWSQHQYLAQWKEGIHRICVKGLNSSLITNMYDPNSSNIVQWWTLHRHEDRIAIRNELFFLENLKQSSFEENIYQYIEERSLINQNGKKISEWQVDVSDLIEFG